MKVIILDIDGTVYDNKNNCRIEPVYNLYKSYKTQGYGVVMCTYRPESYREQTEKLLAELDIVYDKLYMRHNKDDRPPEQTKKYMVDHMRQNDMQPVCAVDDDVENCRMFASEDIFTLYCGGNGIY